MPAPQLLVSIQFESLSLYSDTTIDIISPQYMDTLVVWHAVVDGDGFYQGLSPVPGEWVPYVPYSQMVDLEFWMLNETSYINVTITFPDSGNMISDWGTVVRDGGEIWVDSEIWDWTGPSFPMITTVSHTYNLGYLDGYYTFTFKAWGIDVKSISFTASTAQMLLETDKDTYFLGENVTIILKNIGNETEWIGGYPAWIIYTYPEEEPVFPAIFALLLWELAPGENDTITWSQYNAFTNSPVDVGMYVVRDTQGWGLSAYFTIVNLPPIANFTYSPTVPIVNETVTFDASSSYDPDGTIIGYSWAFGDEIIANDTGPITTHAYADAGNYTVTLYVYDDDYQPDSYTLNVTVTIVENLPPIANFTYSPTFPYVGQTVTFDASGSSDPDGTIVSYEWDFGDGSTGTDALTSYTYESVGTFNVTLTVTDDLGATDTLQQEITVDPLPTLTITINKIKKGTTETILLELVDDDYDGFITQDINNRILSIIKRTHKTTTFDFPGTYTATKGALKVTLQSRNDFIITLS